MKRPDLYFISIFVSGNEPSPAGFAEFTPDQISKRELWARSILFKFYSLFESALFAWKLVIKDLYTRYIVILIQMRRE